MHYLIHSQNTNRPHSPENGCTHRIAPERLWLCGHRSRSLLFPQFLHGLPSGHGSQEVINCPFSFFATIFISPYMHKKMDDLCLLTRWLMKLSIGTRCLIPPFMPLNPKTKMPSSSTAFRSPFVFCPIWRNPESFWRLFFVLFSCRLVDEWIFRLIGWFISCVCFGDAERASKLFGNNAYILHAHDFGRFKASLYLCCPWSASHR